MSSNKLKYILIIIVSVLFLAPGISRAKGDKKDGTRRLSKTTAASNATTFFDINNISTWFFNNGNSDITPNGNSGFVFPKGSGKTAVFTAGLLWGAKVAGDPDPRVGGSAYRTGLVPGNVTASGAPVDPNGDLPGTNMHRVRPDVFPGGPAVDLKADAANENTTESALRAQYESDWTSWPADLGAPYFDGNNNGVYDPSPSSGDVPGVPGADQTIWHVMNDLVSQQTIFLYGANPLGLEVSQTIWGYNRTGALGSMYFRKYTFKNITDRPSSPFPPTTFNNMYVTMWADIDLGDAGDDFIGVDTTLSFQYSYNANAVDIVYSPLPPPAVGFDFFQGPIVKAVAGQDLNRNGVDDGDPSERAIFNNKFLPGFVNLPMTAAFYFANGDATIGDPPQGNLDGSRQFYNFFQGKFGISGATFTDLATGAPTTFALNGDPIKGTGWLDGLQLPAGDRRNGSSSGPFNMAPGDVQEVVVAELVGGALPGTDRISAIGIAKFFDQAAQQAYDNFFDLPNAPKAPVVNIIELENKVVIDWGFNSAAVAATESNNKKGFKFQGYNVYQLPTASAQVSQGRRLATFDVIDGKGKIEDKFFDASTGVVATKVIQFGNDTGIKRTLTVTGDAIKGGSRLINGIKYYFAVTAYNFNPSLTAIPNNLENPIKIITVVPHKIDPGFKQTSDGLSITSVHTAGAGDVVPSVKVVDPTKVNGHKYQFFFKNQDYINDANGNWTKVAPPKAKKDGNLKPTDVSPSTVAMSAVFGDVGGTLELQGSLTLVSPDFDFVDGLKLDMPTGATINSANKLNGKSAVIAGQSVLWGDSSQSTDGFITGDVTFALNVSATLPITVGYTVYDDAWGANNGLGPNANATGSVTVTTAASKRITQKQWGLKDLTAGTTVLDNQTVYGGVDFEYGNGPGGSGKDLGRNLGPDYSVTVDGLAVSMGNLTFAAPATFLGTSQTGAGGLDLWGDAELFGYSNGLNFYNFGGASITPLDLTRDLQFRFTGVTATANDNDAAIQSGGAIATAHSRAGTNVGRVRGPFELWEVETNRQINYAWSNRNADGGNDFGDAVPGWYRMSGRDYIVPVVTPYNENANTTDVRRDSDFSTWVLFFRQGGSSTWATGDVMTIAYANNIVPGTDTFEFTAPSPKSFNNNKAATDVKEINVFPNPYYGVNTEELNKFNRFVTFSHLPSNSNVKIRIFNLAGLLVRTLDKNGGSQFERWDLQNDRGLPVASGLYIAYIEMPDVGATKILKFAVIQEEQFLDKF